MRLMSLSSEQLYIPGMKQKGKAKQNTKKELKETLNWTTSERSSCTGRTGDPAPVYPVGVGCTDALAPEQYAVMVPASQVAPVAPVVPN